MSEHTLYDFVRGLLQQRFSEAGVDRTFEIYQSWYLAPVTAEDLMVISQWLGIPRPSGNDAPTRAPSVPKPHPRFRRRKAPYPFDQESCVICCEALNPNAEKRRDSSVSLTKCKHVFHRGCLKKWCETKGECPVCRATPNDTQ